MNELTKKGFLNTTNFRKNTVGLPSKIKEKSIYNAYNENILIQKYTDKKDIYFATNYNINISKLRDEYNIKNRGVDKFDQNLLYLNSQRRTLKWWKKVFHFGIDSSILNSKILFDKNYNKKTEVFEFKKIYI